MSELFMVDLTVTVDTLPSVPEIPLDVWRQMDPGYYKAVMELLSSFRSSNDVEELLKKFDCFSDNFLVISELWEYRINLLKYKKNTNYYWDFSRMMHFYKLTPDKNGIIHNGQVGNKSMLYKLYLFNFKKTPDGKACMPLKNVKGLFKFPHQRLSDVYRMYHLYGDQVLPQSVYIEFKLAQIDYEEIEAADTLEEKFNAIIDCVNVNSIIQNVEILIAENPYCKWLWKNYLIFLNEHEPKVYLEVFKKYTKFFISDHEMANEFKKEQIRLCCTPAYENAASLSSILFKQHYAYFPVPQKKVIKFYGNRDTFLRYTHQNYIFPRPLIHQILNAANPRILRALFESCKEMFNFQKTPICFNLCCGKTTSITAQTLTVSYRQNAIIPRKIWRLLIINSISISSEKSPKLLSSMISRIWRCDARIFNLKNQNFTLDEFTFFIKPSKVEIFHFDGGQILHRDGREVMMMEVIKMLPNTRKLTLFGLKTTKTLSSELVCLKHKVKIEQFGIGQVMENFSFYHFQEFVMNNAAHRNPSFNIIFASETRRTVVDQFNTLIKQTKLSKSFFNAAFRARLRNP